MSVYFSVHSQSASTDAIVTIVGNPVDNSTSNVNDNNVNVNYANNVVNQTNQPPPPAQQQFAPTDQNIEPTLENGFHMRFQIESPGSVERMTAVGNGATASASTGSAGIAGGAKVKKHSVSMAERSFNMKKKMKNWLPKRKKKYHPTLCEKFR